MEFESITPNNKSIGINPSMLNVDATKITDEQSKKEDLFIDGFKTIHEKIMSNLNGTILTQEQKEDYKKQTSENVEIIKALYSKEQKIKKVKPQIRAEFGDYRSYNRELELCGLEDIHSKVVQTKDKLYTLTANLFKAMYEGVLIPGEISIRRHRICPFRRQYSMSDDDFFDVLRTVENQNIILKTMTNCEQQKVVLQLFEVIRLLDNNKNIVDNERRAINFEVKIPLEEPLLFIDRVGDIKLNLITDINIKDYHIGFNGYELINYFGTKSEKEILSEISDIEFINKMKKLSKEEDDGGVYDHKQQIYLSEKNYLYFINNFGDYIVKISKDLEKLYAFRIDFLDKAIVQIQKIGSKYLIADQLIQQENK